MGTPLVAGRDLTWTDAYDRLPVVMVSENLARELWGDPTAALGKRIRETSTSAWREVVGVVADVHDDGLDQKAPAIVYWPILMKGLRGRRDEPLPGLRDPQPARRARRACSRRSGRPSGR